MDGFLVDLDKVLDDFEEVEERSVVPGLEWRPSGYLQYLQETRDVDYVVSRESSHDSSEDIKYPQQVSDCDQYNDKLIHVSYDTPFPNDDYLDLCDADFAPSPPNKSKAEILNSILISKTNESPLKIIPNGANDSEDEKVVMNNYLNHCDSDTPEHSLTYADGRIQVPNDVTEFRFTALDAFHEIAESSSYSSQSVDNSEEACDSPINYRLTNGHASHTGHDTVGQGQSVSSVYSQDDGTHFGAAASPINLHQEVIAGSFHRRPNQTMVQSAIMTDDILIVQVPEPYPSVNHDIDEHSDDEEGDDEDDVVDDNNIDGHRHDEPDQPDQVIDGYIDTQTSIHTNAETSNQTTNCIVTTYITPSSSYYNYVAPIVYDDDIKTVGFEECVEDIDVSALDEYLHDTSNTLISDSHNSDSITLNDSSHMLPSIHSAIDNNTISHNPQSLRDEIKASASVLDNSSISSDEGIEESFPDSLYATNNIDRLPIQNNENRMLNIGPYNLASLRDLPALHDIAALSANMQNFSLNYPELSEDLRGYAPTMPDLSDEALEHLHIALANDDIENFPDILNNNIEENNNQGMVDAYAQPPVQQNNNVVPPHAPVAPHAPVQNTRRDELARNVESAKNDDNVQCNEPITNNASVIKSEVVHNREDRGHISDNEPLHRNQYKHDHDASQPSSSKSYLSDNSSTSSRELTRDKTPPPSYDSIQEHKTGTGAKPKDTPPSSKMKRPNSLLGLSTILLPHSGTPPQDDAAQPQYTQPSDELSSPYDSDKEEVVLRRHITNDNSTLYKQDDSNQVNVSDSIIQPSIQTQLELHPDDNLNLQINESDNASYSQTIPSQYVEPQPLLEAVNSTEESLVAIDATSHDQVRSYSWSSDSDAMTGQIRRRPNSLDLPVRLDEDGDADAEVGHVGERIQDRVSTPYYPPQGANAELEDTLNNPAPSATAPLSDVYLPDPYMPDPSIASASANTFDQLGKTAPLWVPDVEAPNCMQCEARFTFTKRRHHCRACGKVFCASCCSHRNKIEYMDGKEARVCVACRQLLVLAHAPINPTPTASPHPNNPEDYCSTVPPHEQVSQHSTLPAIMVPVVGVLKREGASKRTEPKQVIFSDGIRPGGDLTEGDPGAAGETSQLPKTSPGRKVKRVDKHTTSEGEVCTVQPALDVARNTCVVPEVGLPPLVRNHRSRAERLINHSPDVPETMAIIQDETADPVVFMVNKNLYVSVKFVNLDCCIHKQCWCFTSDGLVTVGQEEVAILLETLPEETTLPNHVFLHFQHLYEQAGLGHTVTDMGHTIFTHTFLDSKDHGGFLYLRPTFQCLSKLPLPPVPYVFAVLLQKWEIPWAKVFPLRLLLRLGAEYRYYPCPLVSTRLRRPTFYEIGHTIMNLLADFRNYQYMLTEIRGVTIHMEDKHTTITFPMNRYDELMKVVGNSNGHVMALAATFSTQADSHLVCIQNEEGNYSTQAINIQNKPRKVTGASFVVFNGALKTSTGFMAKSSIIEDGLMVQITPETMAGLKQSMKDMKSFVIWCGSVSTQNPDETVTIRWGEDDANFNVGVKSAVDGIPLDGIKSLHIHKSTDYVGDNCLIRWTEVFFLKTEEGNSRWEPVDLSRLAESLARATCVALTPHLDKLKDASLHSIAIRAMIDTEQVSYDAGSGGDKLPDFYMNDLDNELIPVIHNAASQNQHTPIMLELVFHVLE